MGRPSVADLRGADNHVCECVHLDGRANGCGGSKGGASGGHHRASSPAVASHQSRHHCRGVSCPVCSVMAVLSAVLLMASTPLVSCAECGGHGSLHGDHCDCDKGYQYGSSQLICELKECGGHGVLHGDHCDCEKGYGYGASKLVCVKPSWTNRLGDVGHSARNHVWQLLGQDPTSVLGVSEVQAMLDGLRYFIRVPYLQGDPLIFGSCLLGFCLGLNSVRCCP